VGREAWVVVLTQRVDSCTLYRRTYVLYLGVGREAWVVVLTPEAASVFCINK
jgi:hypothetical protein